MCQRLYVATREVLASRRKTKKSPYLALTPAGEVLPGVRGHLQPECRQLYVAEAFAPCGCGFPEETEGHLRKARKPEPEGRRTMDELVTLLLPLVKARPRVQLYLCFLGEEDEPVDGERTVGIGDLARADFRFRNREVLTVVKQGV